MSVSTMAANRPILKTCYDVLCTSMKSAVARGPLGARAGFPADVVDLAQDLPYLSDDLKPAEDTAAQRLKLCSQLCSTLGSQPATSMPSVRNCAART